MQLGLNPFCSHSIPGEKVTQESCLESGTGWDLSQVTSIFWASLSSSVTQESRPLPCPLACHEGQENELMEARCQGDHPPLCLLSYRLSQDPEASTSVFFSAASAGPTWVWPGHIGIFTLALSFRLL